MLNQLSKILSATPTSYWFCCKCLTSCVVACFLFNKDNPPSGITCNILLIEGSIPALKLELKPNIFSRSVAPVSDIALITSQVSNSPSTKPLVFFHGCNLEELTTLGSPCLIILKVFLVNLAAPVNPLAVKPPRTPPILLIAKSSFPVTALTAFPVRYLWPLGSDCKVTILSNFLADIPPTRGTSVIPSVIMSLNNFCILVQSDCLATHCHTSGGKPIFSNEGLDINLILLFSFANALNNITDSGNAVTLPGPCLITAGLYPPSIPFLLKSFLSVLYCFLTFGFHIFLASPDMSSTKLFKALGSLAANNSSWYLRASSLFPKNLPPAAFLVLIIWLIESTLLAPLTIFPIDNIPPVIYSAGKAEVKSKIPDAFWNALVPGWNTCEVSYLPQE